MKAKKYSVVFLIALFSLKLSAQVIVETANGTAGDIQNASRMFFTELTFSEDFTIDEISEETYLERNASKDRTIKHWRDGKKRLAEGFLKGLQSGPINMLNSKTFKKKFAMEQAGIISDDANIEEGLIFKTEIFAITEGVGTFTVSIETFFQARLFIYDAADREKPLFIIKLPPVRVAPLSRSGGSASSLTTARHLPTEMAAGGSLIAGQINGFINQVKRTGNMSP